jgi:hypothetical protein
VNHRAEITACAVHMAQGAGLIGPHITYVEMHADERIYLVEVVGTVEVDGTIQHERVITVVITRRRITGELYAHVQEGMTL